MGEGGDQRHGGSRKTLEGDRERGKKTAGWRRARRDTKQAWTERRAPRGRIRGSLEARSSCLQHLPGYLLPVPLRRTGRVPGPCPSRRWRVQTELFCSYLGKREKHWKAGRKTGNSNSMSGNKRGRRGQGWGNLSKMWHLGCRTSSPHLSLCTWGLRGPSILPLPTHTAARRLDKACLGPGKFAPFS